MRTMGWLPITLVMGCSEYNPGSFLNPSLPPTEDEVPEGWSIEAFDTFQGGEGSTADVIVWGDTSGSMDEELKTLGDTITPFVEALAEYVDDWQLASVTGDTGCSTSGVLTPDTAGYANKFADGIVDHVGDSDNFEHGFQNVLLALQNTGNGECNEGLLRGGLLHVIFVSDENEESPGFDQSPDYWREWVDRIGEAAGDPSQVRYSAVAGPTPGGCTGADPGFGYDRAVAATGGEFLSICDDWASQIDLLADAVALRDTFALAETPVPSTIQVWVDDRKLTTAEFSYDERNNTITLAAPVGDGQEVSVLYEVAVN